MCLVLISISAIYYNLPVVVIIELSTNTAYCHDGVPTKRLQFSSKEEVTKNLGCLGQWMKVFICYSPSFSSKETRGKLESCIYTFARHLITYGFDIRVDLFASSTVGFDWASWTDREMSQADWIIFVNSKSSYELLCHLVVPKKLKSLHLMYLIPLRQLKI